MVERSGPVLVLALLTGLVPAATGWAQAPALRPSHVPLPGEPVTPATADEYLRQRLLQAEMAGDLQKLAGDILRNPEKYKLQAEELQGMLRSRPDLKDPGLRQAVERVLRQQAQQETDPDKAARWQEALRRLGEGDGPRKPGGTGGAGGPTDRGEGGGPKPPVAGGGERPPVQPGDAGEPVRPPRVGPATADPDRRLSPEQPADGRRGGRPAGGGLRSASPETIRQLQQIAERLRGTPLEGSPAVRQMVNNLDRVPVSRSSGGFDWSGPRQKLEEELSRWQGRGGGGPSWPRLDQSPLGGWTGAGMGGGGMRWTPGPLPGSSGPGEDWEVLGLLVGGVGAVFLGWVGWQWYRRRRALTAGEHRHAAALLVGPEGIHSRSDVVTAFESLALVRLGPEARTSHHHAIADGLGRESNERAVAAERLAEIYEQARYAPPEESLSEDALREARQKIGRLVEARV